MLFSPIPDPRLELDAPPLAPARLMLEQNEMFDFLRELCRSKVFCAENGEGLTRYLLDKGNG
jgi:hypothetical protein